MYCKVVLDESHELNSECGCYRAREMIADNDTLTVRNSRFLTRPALYVDTEEYISSMRTGSTSIINGCTAFSLSCTSSKRRPLHQHTRRLSEHLSTRPRYATRQATGHSWGSKPGQTCQAHTRHKSRRNDEHQIPAIPSSNQSVFACP